MYKKNNTKDLTNKKFKITQTLTIAASYAISL